MNNFRNRLLKGTVGGADQSSWRGVFIEDTTGKLWTIDSWDGSATFNSVAVISDTHSFGIAGEHTYATSFSPMSSWTDMASTFIAFSYGRPSFATVEDAYLDFDGEGNTALILAEQGESSDFDAYAAQQCNSYTFPNGKKGYLMSAGEFHMIDEYWAEINSILKHLSLQELELGGTNSNLIGTWTSTYCGEEQIITLQSSDGDEFNISLTGGTYAYAFTELTHVTYLQMSGYSIVYKGGQTRLSAIFPDANSYYNHSGGGTGTTTVDFNIGCRPVCRLMNF